MSRSGSVGPGRPPRIPAAPGQTPLKGVARRVEGGTVAKEGRRVEFTIVDTRGALAEYEVTGDPSKRRRTVAVNLAADLGVDVSTLLGRRFTCWVEPTQYGSIQSDFQI